MCKRRSVVAGAGGWSIVGASAVRAQSWPSQQIKIVVPYIPGGATDTAGRVIAEKLTALLGQQVIVENKGGGNTIIGMEAVAKAKPDGHTLLLGSTTLATNAALGLKQPFEQVTPELQDALKIGHFVMHKLNRIEWVCCAFSWLLLARIRMVRTRGSLVLLGAITALLAFQTWGLYPPLDERTRQIILGTLPPLTWHHMGFVITEGIKALLLGVLTGAQIQAFAQAVVSE